jgi:molybdopterin-guanine dinucleotide biosynthesis protein A
VTKRIAGAIVAGGRAARLGGIAKGLLRVGDSRMIDRVAGALRPQIDELLIVTDSPDAATWLPNARIVRDALIGGGAAAGVHAALSATRGPVLAVAWDMPFVTRELCAALVARAAAGDADAVVPQSPTAKLLEPMCAWYAPVCADAIAAGWDAGDRSLHGMLARVRTVVLPLHVVERAGDPDRLFLNVNTQAELERARHMAMGEGEEER